MRYCRSNRGCIRESTLEELVKANVYMNGKIIEDIIHLNLNGRTIDEYVLMSAMSSDEGKNMYKNDTIINLII